MAYASYHVFDGEVMGFEQTGVYRDLFSDPQGSVAYHLTNFHLTSASTTYWPYGRIRSRTGSIDIPFHYIGAYGYYRDTRAFTDTIQGRYYVRARYYTPYFGQWTTVDPLWPQEPAYAYVRGNPINQVDPSGRNPALINSAGTDHGSFISAEDD